MNSQKQKIEGIVTEALPDTTFRVKLDDAKEILAYLAGRMKIHYVRVIPGDRVVVEMSEYDKGRGRIIYRK